MPLHVIALDNNSWFGSGLAHGHCEYYDTSKQKAMKGFFAKSVLTGSNNVLILFTNTTFQYFIGQYINNNKPNGSMVVYDFAGNGSSLYDINTPITVAKKSCTYSNGTLVSTQSSNNIQVNIVVNHKEVDGIVFMTGFTLTEI
jgi:hypothetical protein